MKSDKWRIFEALDYARKIKSDHYGTRSYPVPEVRAFHNSDARIKISTAPARSGKSWSAAHDIIPDILEPLFSPTPVSGRYPERRHLIAGPEYEHSSKEFHVIVEALVHNRGKLGIPGPTRCLEQPKLGRLEIYWKEWNTWLIGKSVKQLHSLLGDQWITSILSETAQMDSRVWRQGLSTRVGRSIWPTTPSVRGRWIKDFYEESLAACDSNVQHFRFPPWANPFYDKVRFDEELRRRGADDPYFKEQFLGDWDVWYGGRVFPTFQPDPVEEVDKYVSPHGISGGDGSHCVDPFIIPAHWQRIGGIDFGWRDPTVFLWLAVAPDGTCVVYDEYSATQRSMGEHTSMIEAKCLDNGTQWPIDVFREPKGQSKQISEDMMMDHNFHTFPVKADRLSGRLRVQEFLDRNEAGMPRLRVFKEKCPELVRSLLELHYDDGGIGREGAVEKWIGPDHAVDALKYALLSRTSVPLLQQRPDVHARPTLDRLIRDMKRRNRRHGYIGRDRDRYGRLPHA